MAPSRLACEPDPRRAAIELPREGEGYGSRPGGLGGEERQQLSAGSAAADVCLGEPLSWSAAVGQAGRAGCVWVRVVACGEEEWLSAWAGAVSVCWPVESLWRRPAVVTHVITSHRDRSDGRQWRLPDLKTIYIDWPWRQIQIHGRSREVSDAAKPLT